MPTQAKDGESSHVSPDKIIEDIGGCGRFQVRMAIVVHLIKTIICFTFTGMIFISKTPAWWCEDEMIGKNMTSCIADVNGTSFDFCPKKACNINGAACSRVNFDRSLTTVATEFNLVCDQDFIPSTISSVQIAGTLVGNIAAGQIADLIGRKPPFFASILLIFSFNIVGYFSSSWQVFAVARFFLGIGCGFFLTTQYCFLSEFSLARWRVWIVGFPSWPIQAGVFSLLAWLLHDWRYIQLMTALCAIPCLLAWFALPESFRWYIAHDKPEKAAQIITRIAKYNKHEESDIDKVLDNQEEQEDQKYTVLHLFKSRYLTKITILLSFSWFALGVVKYGIEFGIQELSGNIYLNVFLFSIVGIPGKAVALWLQNRFGRRATSVICFIVVAVGGFVVGFVPTFNAPHKDELTNGFALVANMGITMAWGPVQTMTIELYPTVIRYFYLRL
ncbi:organic cation transporter protein-like [Ruditapes philippinarum]|uniref:organic cation transporter protein-like n=1 Tax=Ruditapes philippinarum TaxID=129788 RepID=UPI00295AE9FC|nr:organic cation transporter protein-like [Ruditapes philippinarum]